MTMVKGLEDISSSKSLERKERLEMGLKLDGALGSWRLLMDETTAARLCEVVIEPWAKEELQR